MDDTHVTVRIGLAIDRNGRWVAWGNSDTTDPIGELIVDDLAEGEQRYIIRATVEKPTTPIIGGTAEPHTEVAADGAA